MSNGVNGIPSQFNWKKLIFLFLGISLFSVAYYSPPWPDAVDPLGKHFELTREGKGALAVFLLAGTWWVFEVVPIGITSLAIGVLQALFLIRPAKVAGLRLKPGEVAEVLRSIPADVVVIAIGQSPNPMIPNTTSGLETGRRGNITVDEGTMKTSKKGVFAGGDVATGGATVILAMGQGKIAAEAINEYLETGDW